MNRTGLARKETNALFFVLHPSRFHKLTWDFFEFKQKIHIILDMPIKLFVNITLLLLLWIFRRNSNITFVNTQLKRIYFIYFIFIQKDVYLKILLLLICFIYNILQRYSNSVLLRSWMDLATVLVQGCRIRQQQQKYT